MEETELRTQSREVNTPEERLATVLAFSPFVCLSLFVS